MPDQPTEPDDPQEEPMSQWQIMHPNQDTGPYVGLWIDVTPWLAAHCVIFGGRARLVDNGEP